MAFVMVWVMIGIVGIWAMSAVPMLQRFGHFIAPNMIPEYAISGEEGDETEAEDVALGEAVQSSGEIVFPITVPTSEPIIENVQPTATPIPVVVSLDVHMPTAQPQATLLPTQEAAQEPETSPFMKKAHQFCGDCDGYSVQIKYTHYWPPEGGTNCWLWNEVTQTCDSPTYSGIPWQSAIGWGAACPYDWGIGTWIEVPYWGSVMCVDRGAMACVQGSEGWICEVDILAENIGAIDGQILESEVYIP